MTPLLTDLPALPTPGAAACSSQLHECARYHVGDRGRVLCTRMVEGETVLLDMPADRFDATDDPAASNDSYLVEPDLSRNTDELEALIADYLQQVAAHRRVPMTVPLLEGALETPL
jgi:hypothetical protein